jgi:ABC-2 type transport system permease protein
LVNAVFILIAGYILFGVTVNGSYFLLIVTTLIFLMASIAAGIFFSIIADTQQVAFSAATFFSLLPSLILSGFVFPIESMPYLVQLLTNITPVKFYLIALRAIIIRGVGLEAFWQQWVYLGLFGLFFTILTIIIGRKQMSAT